MLILARKLGQRIRIGNDIEVMVTRITQDGVRLGIQAPRHVPADREEVRADKDTNGPAKAPNMIHVSQEPNGSFTSEWRTQYASIRLEGFPTYDEALAEITQLEQAVMDRAARRHADGAAGAA